MTKKFEIGEEVWFLVLGRVKKGVDDIFNGD